MTPPGRVVLLVTSPRVPAGLLSAAAWRALEAGPVFTADPAAPGPAAAADAGVSCTRLDPAAPAVVARTLVSEAIEHGHATWWIGPAGDHAVTHAVAQACADRGAAAVELEVMHGSWDAPGARLLDVVATMDRLRSPNGCPWDASQDHASLAKYLLEEAYEAFQAIEDRDLDALREELGDVLLQIVFHARIAEELPDGKRWTIDDVAGGLVEKLVRRHPHVFEGVEVADADEVNRNWEAIKAAERGDASALANVPLAAPALTLAATMQRKAARADGAEPAVGPLGDAVARFQATPNDRTAGELLWVLVAAMRAADLDPEQALRTRARAFRDSHGSPDATGDGR